jgi:hypothetical protein
MDVNVEELFESLGESNSSTEEQTELLNKIMELETPLDFDDDFATEEELDLLESTLDNELIFIPTCNIVKRTLEDAIAIISTQEGFI